MSENKYPFGIAESINNKYQLSFHFFNTKFINELIYSIGSPLSINFQDMKCYYDDIEYLRRSYKERTIDGKNQIQGRIKLVSKYYIENQMLTSQMPMMFITKTKDLFLRRQKRLKKIKQIDNQSKSESESQSFGVGSLSLSFQQDYLKQLKINLSQLMNSEDYSYNINGELDSQVHDIYLDNTDDFSDIQILKIDLKKSQSMIDHLICDFQDIDINGAISFYKDIKKSKNGSAVMNQIFSKNSQRTKQNENLRLHSGLRGIKSKSQKQTVLNNYISIFGPKKSKQKKTLSKQNRNKQNRYSDHLFLNKYLNQYTKICQSQKVQNEEQQKEQNPGSIEVQKEELNQNRKKIRQKAQKLLQKIKRESFSVQIG